MCTKHREFLGKGFFAKALYMPLLLVSSALSLFVPQLVLIPAAQIISLFAFYGFVGVNVQKGTAAIAFLFGVMMGLRRMIKA